MRTDIWTHFLSPAYVEYLEARQGRSASFLLAQRVMHDLPFRLQVIEEHVDYRQVLTPLPAPFVFDGETLSTPSVFEVVRRNNDELAEITGQHPDQFAGFLAATPISDPDSATTEAVRAVAELGALGVQLEADSVDLPLHDGRYEPLFAAMAERGAGVWLHPCRPRPRPEFATEKPSAVPWQVFGWTFDTTITISQLIFSGIFDRHPDLKLIAHHGGGLIPHFSGRIEAIPRLTGLDPSGALAQALDRLQKTPIDYFRMLYVDTAMFHSQHGVRCVVDFFGPDRVLFGTDAPFDGQAGSYLIRQTTADLEDAIDTPADRDAIFEGNASRILQTKTARLRL
jgi:aminocarboxymuconate-semialdehyde decarboxylase